MQAGAVWTLVDLELPRFEMRFKTELGDLLRELGLQTAFDAASADFGGITPHPDGRLSESVHIMTPEAGTRLGPSQVVELRGSKGGSQ